MIKSKFLTPFQKFVKIESLSGILLFSATLIAMILANSSFSAIYQSIWQYKLGIGSEALGLTKPLILWINDGLMAIFFFLIGLEIKRELVIGELNTIRKATFPVFAAIGGMVVPLSLFLVLNNNPETAVGWGIPMATDIAFSLAILKVLGKAVPLSLKIFLTAFAIIDDLGAVLIIAIFYSGGINWVLLLYACILLAILFLASFKNLYSKYFTFFIGIIIWSLFLKSGIHPTIAGVLLAFTIPIRQKVDVTFFTDKLSFLTKEIANSEDQTHQVLSKKQIEQIDNLEDLIEDFHSPLQHLEHKLHGWVAYCIMPIFALANAGIVFSSNMHIDASMIINIVAALFIGKLLGVSVFSYIALKLKVAELPKGITFRHVIGVAILAGVGFTMSIFIANLAFSESSIFIASAKIGIIIGSVLSGICGVFVLKFIAKSGREFN